MGTSCAVWFANLYFGFLERSKLLPRFKDLLARILFYARFVDDVFLIWLGECDLQWKALVLMFNDFGILKWECPKPKTTVDFLDLTYFDNRRQQSSHEDLSEAGESVLIHSSTLCTPRWHDQRDRLFASENVLASKHQVLGLRPLLKSPISASLLARLGPGSFETSVLFCLKQTLQES